MDNQEKYKILINGRNGSFATDFMQYTESYFKCLSTSDCLQDVLNHFEIFEPDAYVCFVESESSRNLAQTSSLKEYPFSCNVPIIVICDDKTASAIGYSARFSVDMIVKRPISADNLALRIIRFFEELNEKKAEELGSKNEGEEKPSAENAPEAEAPEASPAEKKHILVVDDDRTVLKMLKTALSGEFDVTTMVNGIMVEKFLESKKVDLVILDYEMPIETGAEILRKIRSNDKIKRVPVCFLTGISDRDKIMEVMALRPHSYILKPIDMDMLFSTVKSLTE